MDIAPFTGSKDYIKTTTIYNADNGLASRFVNYTFRDSRGIIWIGSQGGLQRFDGRNFKLYDEAWGLPFNQVMHIYEDKVGYLWLYRSCKGKPVSACIPALAFFHPITEEVRSFEAYFGEAMPFNIEDITYITAGFGKFYIGTAQITYCWTEQQGFHPLPANSLDKTPQIVTILEDGRLGAIASNGRDFIYYLIDNKGKIWSQYALSQDVFQANLGSNWRVDYKIKHYRSDLAQIMLHRSSHTDSLIVYALDKALLINRHNRHRLFESATKTVWQAGRAGVQKTTYQKKRFQHISEGLGTLLVDQFYPTANQQLLVITNDEKFFI